MTITIPETEYAALKAIVDREYTDGLDRILSAQENDDGSIVCVGQDGIKQIGCKITDTSIQIRLLNPDRVQADAAPSTAQFSATKPDIPSQIATNLQRIGDPIFGGWLGQIKQMLETTDDLESAKEALFQLYPDLDSTELTEQMTDAMALASMAGFWDAGLETGDEAEFAKIPEGTTRRRDGVDYVLRDSRWHKTEVQAGAKKKILSTSEPLKSTS